MGPWAHGMGMESRTFSGQVYFFFAPLFIPFFVMGVPIIDTAFAIVRRARKRVGVAEADKDHLHHRLMRLGHGHRRSVVILWLWASLLAAATGRDCGQVATGARPCVCTPSLTCARTPAVAR